MNLKERLERLKREKESRSRGMSFRKWKQEREAFRKKCKKGYSPDPGELANMIDGLTPDGYDKKGRKVSFVEKGKNVLDSDKRIGEEVARISK